VNFLPRKYPDYPERTITTEKHMLTIFCNPGGFHVMTIVPKETSFNTVLFIDGNVVLLRDQFFSGGRMPSQKKLMVHIDNASSPYCTGDTKLFTHNELRKLAYPSYSPDITPLDFDLFGKVKTS
jgi:hypothetical protein